MINNSFYDRNAFLISLDSFSGPIDLLLHLVKTNELEISKLSLAEVCEQYLSCIKVMEQLDLDLASEYLVIAATLVSIKSNILLNKPVELIEDEEGNMIDPQDELLRRLREAEIYKEAALNLENLDLLERDVFAPQGQLGSFDSVDRGLAEHDSYLLVKALSRTLKRLDDQKVYKVVLESVSIVERMSYVVDQLGKSADALSFDYLVHNEKSRGNIIGTFLALLELCKRQAIFIKQDKAGEDILIGLSEKSVASEMYSEYDDDKLLQAV